MYRAIHILLVLYSSSSIVLPHCSLKWHRNEERKRITVVETRIGFFPSRESRSRVNPLQPITRFLGDVQFIEIIDLFTASTYFLSA